MRTLVRSFILLLCARSSFIPSANEWWFFLSHDCQHQISQLLQSPLPLAAIATSPALRREPTHLYLVLGRKIWRKRKESTSLKSWSGHEFKVLFVRDGVKYHQRSLTQCIIALLPINIADNVHYRRKGLEKEFQRNWPLSPIKSDSKNKSNANNQLSPMWQLSPRICPKNKKSNADNNYRQRNSNYRQYRR